MTIPPTSPTASAPSAGDNERSLQQRLADLQRLLAAVGIGAGDAAAKAAQQQSIMQQIQQATALIEGESEAAPASGVGFTIYA